MKTRALPLLFAFFILFITTHLSFAQSGKPQITDYIRQFAKDRPTIYIITSGVEATEIARTLQKSILEHHDVNKDKKVQLLTLSEVETEAKTSAFQVSIRIFLFARNELPASLPNTVKDLLPLSVDIIKEFDSTFTTVCLVPKAGDLAFSSLLIAPDIDRLKRLLDVFRSKSFSSYKEMLPPATETYLTHKIALFSDETSRPYVEKWGRVTAPRTWLQTKWYPINEFSKLTKESLQECNLAFFVEGHHRPNPAPPPLLKLLEQHNLTTSSVLVKKIATPEGYSTAVILAPDERILAKKVARYTNFADIPDNLLLVEAKDLHKIGGATLVVSGQGPTDDQKELIRALIAKTMRNELLLTLEERGEILRTLQKEITLEELQGATGTAEFLRRQGNLQYVWLYSVADYLGSTSYRTNERSLAGIPPTFTEGEPPEPSPQKPFFGGRKPKEQYEKEMADWKPLHTVWEQHRREFQVRLALTPCQWEREITLSSTAKVRGTLRLVDLKEGSAKVVWEYECHATITSPPAVYRSDKVVVRGYRNRPTPLEAPQNEAVCPPDMLRETATTAGRRGLDVLQEEVVLPDSRYPDVVAHTPPDDTPAKAKPVEKAEASDKGKSSSKPEPETKSPAIENKITPLVVVEVQADDGVVTVTPPENVTPHIGDIFYVLKKREIRDPTTGKVIETREQGFATLKVRVVSDKTVDCVPATPQDKAILAQILPGMKVKFSPRTPVTKNKPQ